VTTSRAARRPQVVDLGFCISGRFSRRLLLTCAKSADVAEASVGDGRGRGTNTRHRRDALGPPGLRPRARHKSATDRRDCSGPGAPEMPSHLTGRIRSGGTSGSACVSWRCAELAGRRSEPSPCPSLEPRAHYPGDAGTPSKCRGHQSGLHIRTAELVTRSVQHTGPLARMAARAGDVAIRLRGAVCRSAVAGGPTGGAVTLLRCPCPHRSSLIAHRSSLIVSRRIKANTLDTAR
jgi:hypothetical protein